MKRREFISLLGGAAAAWPLAARAQQAAMPVVGFIDSRSPDALTDRLRGFRQGLRDAGYVEGENLTIAYRWAENQLDRLPILAAELVRRPVSVIAATGGTSVVLAAKAASSKIPVVFLAAEDPVRLGLVASLARPGGNLTGINFFNTELVGKLMELLRELVPAATRIAVLVNPVTTTTTETVLRDAGAAASVMGVQINTIRASSSLEIDAAFATLARERPDGLLVPGDPFFNARRLQLAQLAGRYGLPAIYSGREFADVGGLVSYGSDITHAYRQLGIYAGRILKGAKPADLPVIQASKFELVINHQTARMIGLTVPDKLLAAADEVIE
jgi:putative tryptophan/tyrosine transport system substrate-binding protein